MCGIFGFVLLKPVKVTLALRMLTILETHQYANEKNPVGGHGAGVYFLDTHGRENFVKVGKTDGSPAKLLSEKFLETNLQTRLLMGHVRFASINFLDTISFRECTQPYVASCTKQWKVVSVHNGFVRDYGEMRKNLSSKHHFESEERGELIDSEVLPHLLEELLLSKADAMKAMSRLSALLENQGGNTLSMLLLGKRLGNFLVFVHHGRTRGLTVWSNPEGEILFSSRKMPVKQVLGEFLKDNDFEEKLSIAWKEPRNIKPMIFQLPPRIFA
jgi:glucosamine 6-phosphate synthetase-like amidotransferase/phosphosugar isomerase protein